MQGLGISNPKLFAMIGMFYDHGTDSKIVRNVAVGSERAGFNGVGIKCDAPTSFLNSNEVHSSLSGYWFDYYEMQNSENVCMTLSSFTAWKISLYAVYGDIVGPKRLDLTALVIADCQVGIYVSLSGANAVNHELVDKLVNISDSLMIGASMNSNQCVDKRPSLFTCSFFMAWCDHLKTPV